MTLSHATARRLVARTELIDDPGDLLRHLGSGGAAYLDGDTGFVTAGIAAYVEPAGARAALAAIGHERDGNAPAGSGPRAVGALAFDGGGLLVIPARIVARDPSGQTWRTTIADVALGAPAPPAPTPTRFSVTAATDRNAWTAMVDRALAAIAAGDLEKVVLARAVDVVADGAFSVPVVLDVLRHTQPGCTVYADGDFVGASPELLVQRRGRTVASRPMAGTGDDPTRLLASAKDGREHQIVVDAVAAILAEHCTSVRAEGPTAMRFADVTHLATTISGQLADIEVSALDLAQQLHPTPAVGGWPRAEALTLLHTLEDQARDRYAGPLGWVDAAGDGAFVVALRCARIDGATARLYAGAGIVAGSEAAAEWAETQAKLEPMLRALVRP